jgi:hypothetical protein
MVKKPCEYRSASHTNSYSLSCLSNPSYTHSKFARSFAPNERTMHVSKIPQIPPQFGDMSPHFNAVHHPSSRLNRCILILSYILQLRMTSLLKARILSISLSVGCRSATGVTTAYTDRQFEIPHIQRRSTCSATFDPVGSR